MRKLVLLACVAIGLVTLWAGGCTQRSHTSASRIVVLGIDGLDPHLARGWMREGRLPNLQTLAARGGAYQVQTVPSPSCEGAWFSFAVSKESRQPALVHQPAQLLLNFALLGGEKWSSTRAGTAFWTAAGRAGVRTSTIAVPGTFPPEEVPNGELLAGLPLPDIRGTNGTYHFFSTKISASEEGITKNLGILRRLTFEQRVARTRLAGPLHPVTREELGVPVTVTWNHEARSANIEIGPETIHLREREWSRWLDVEFAVNTIVRVRGVVQLLLLDAGTELQLYVSPVQWHPAHPPAAISSPASFAGELYDRLGLFRTLGWNAATGALADERLDEAAFLDDIDRAFQDRAETILNRLDAGEWDLLVGVVDTPDRVQHMMWRLTDATHPRYDAESARRYASSIEQSYQQADELLGEIVSRVPPDTIIIVVSDHGFHAVRSSSKWSGDHTASDPASVAGFLVTNRALTVNTPRLIDIAPTILKHFAVAAPNDFDGRALF